MLSIAEGKEKDKGARPADFPKELEWKGEMTMKAIQAILIGAMIGAAAWGGAASVRAAETPAAPAVSTKEETVMQGKTYSSIPEDQIFPYKGNQWGLVYDGAIRENVPGQVQIHPITYELDGVAVAANVYTPAGYDPQKSYAAVAVAHPNGGTKEQVAGLYAQRLAEAGFITIAADASYQGASGGEPRHLDVPAHRIEDVHGMVDILSIFPGVDKTRIGALGICGGGGYTLAAVQTDPRVAAVATLSMFNSGIVRRDGYGVTHPDPETAQKTLAQAAAARQKEVETGVIDLTPNMTETLTSEEADKLPFDLYREGYYYYGKDYYHPNDTFSYTVSSLMDLVAFDAAQNMALIRQPLLMIAGSRADSLYMTEDAFAKATGTADKELFLVPGATHIQTYWVKDYVDTIADKLTSFFIAKLARK